MWLLVRPNTDGPWLPFLGHNDVLDSLPHTGPLFLKEHNAARVPSIVRVGIPE